ncbi:cyclase family protein [Novosphingobium sp. ZN18A2]|uniref:cyclase family protein n=1 Tax=Novosphingobium sp. ZN18A2 TaxID=3079861 RepID=UPI0030D28882
MGRTSDGKWAEGWSPPKFEVNANGKVIGATNSRRPNNWGRWGELDQRGTVNFITPEKVAQAASLVRSGRVVSCAIPLDATGPVHPARSNIVHLHSATGCDHAGWNSTGQTYSGLQGTDDYIMMPLQGSTQWDGLAHIGADDCFFNGFWVGVVEAAGGATRLGIQNMKDTFTSRGVLIDLPRHQGVERLEQGHAITADQIDAAADAQGVSVGTGDILVVRTGHVPWYYTLQDKSAYWSGAPGLSMSMVEWLHEKEVAAVAMDNIAIEVEPFEEPYDCPYPVHVRLIRDLGLSLGEIWWLEDLAKACEEEGRWEFMLVAPPLNVTNASGSPVNPTAIF